MTPAPQKTKSPQTPTVFVVDDDPAVCNFICGVVGEAGYPCQAYSNAQAFLDALDINAAGCIMLDIRMPNMTGPELQAALIERGCRLPIIFLAAKPDVRTTVNVLQRGAIDLIEKESCKPSVLIESVQRAIAKDAAQRAEVLELNDLRQRAAEMTPREVEVADLLADGKSNKQAAAVLGLSERTVEIHRGRIMAKMRCESIVNFGIQWLKIQQARRSSAPKIER